MANYGNVKCMLNEGHLLSSKACITMIIHGETQSLIRSGT